MTARPVNPDPLPVANGGTGTSSLTANYGLFGNGTGAVQADSGFTRTGSNGRYLFGGATDDGTSKVQVKGNVKFNDAGALTSLLINGPNLTSSNTLTLSGASAAGGGGSVTVNGGSSTNGGSYGGNFTFIAGTSTGAGGFGGSALFQAGDCAGIGGTAGNLQMLAGATLVDSGYIQLSDSIGTNSAFYYPATGLFVSNDLQFGTYTAGVVVQTGYITVTDFAGTTRKLLVG